MFGFGLGLGLEFRVGVGVGVRVEVRARAWARVEVRARVCRRSGVTVNKFWIWKRHSVPHTGILNSSQVRNFYSS